MPYNHKLTAKALIFTSKTGSRNRLRIPVSGVRHLDIRPGDRVNVFYDTTNFQVTVLKNDRGNYKVEKDGAVRFPAHKFALPASDVTIASDSLNQNVACV
jgi:hypothetical protein